jgi:hypothetical protein
MNPQVISWLNVEKGNADYDPDDPQWGLKILAEGDSWFSLRGIPTSNLLITLDFGVQTLVVSCAQPGATIRKMSEMMKNQGVKNMTSSRFGYKWNAILVSGGGNDLIDDAKRIIRASSGGVSNDPAAYCDDTALHQAMASITAAYEKFVQWRDRNGSSCKDCPMIAHTYDLATPRKAPSRFFGLKLRGPWLYPAMLAAQVPENMRIPVSDHILGRLGQTIIGLENRLPNFKVARTQGTLERAQLGTTLFSGDWADEIHPSMKGYYKLADKLTALI